MGKDLIGKAIGNMKVTDIRNLDIQRVINDMNKQGRASSSMRDALGRVRECLESAKNNRIIDINPCFEINVPWENKTAERRFLSMAEQTRFLQEVEQLRQKQSIQEYYLSQASMARAMTRLKASRNRRGDI